MHKRCLIVWVLGAVALVVLGTARLYAMYRDPDIVFLFPEAGAQWIRIDRPILIKAFKTPIVENTFTLSFEVDEPPPQALLTFRALKTAEVALDGKILYESTDPFDSWKEPKEVDLGPALTRGPHELSFRVYNDFGPVALLAYCETLDLRTGPGWNAGGAPAAMVGDIRRTQISMDLPRADRAFLSRLPIFIPIFLLFALWRALWLRPTALPPWLKRLTPGPATFRWILIGAWIVLALNNIWKISYRFGFDILGHIEYIDFIASHWRLPLATDGWQMFQSPFFHLLCAGPYSILLNWFSLPDVTKALRVIPLACGILQVEIAYRSLRHVYPNRADLQIAGTAVAGLVPVNIYMAQYLSNEPLAACFSAAIILAVIGLLTGRPPTRPFAFVSILGLLMGLTIMTKVSAILLMLPVSVVVVYQLAFANHHGTEQWKKRAALVAAWFGTVTAVSGWFFLRNWIVFGKPLVFGWDPELDNLWWQDPAFRSMGQLFGFGDALTYPIYSGARSYLDAAYSTFWMDGYLSGVTEIGPPWNYNFMLAGAWLALLPMAAILAGCAGAVVPLAAAKRRVHIFSVMCTGLFAAATVSYFLEYPFLCAMKGSYMLSLLPCFAVLAAAGFHLFTRSRRMDPIVYGALGTWALCSYASYFVI